MIFSVISYDRPMNIESSILATLAYYDGLDYPLSLFEAYRYCINPKRLNSQVEGLGQILLRDIQESLAELCKKDLIIEESGFYCLKGRAGLATSRIEREKISAQKWRRCLNLGYWLQLVPWIRGMFVSGSLAMGTVSAKSDFDILILVEPGRMYIARLFLSGMATLLRSRRTKFESTAPDKFCFNHYLTTDNLKITHESLYNAQTYSHLVPMAVNQELVGKFFAENLWINKFVYNFTPHQQTIRRTIRPSSFLKGVARLVEIILNNKLGDTLELKAKKYQQKRISENPLTHASGGRVIYTDKELEFHPQSFEKVILDKYNNTVRRLGISLNSEVDSGLNW